MISFMVTPSNKGQVPYNMIPYCPVYLYMVNVLIVSLFLVQERVNNLIRLFRAI